MESRWAFLVSRLAKFNRYFDEVSSSDGPQLNRFLCLFDFGTAFLRHGATVADYFGYEFYRKRGWERRQFVTVMRAKAIYRFMNDLHEGDALRDKSRFHRAFADLARRQYFDPTVGSASEFSAFARSQQTLIVKPVDATWGAGVRLIRVAQKTDLLALYDELRRARMIAEEVIRQTEQMAAFHMASVNTIRLTTVLRVDRPRVMTAALRLGNAGAIVDNVHGGGLCAAVEAETGTVMSTAVDAAGRRYVRHPMTSKQILGFVVPCWGDVVELVTTAAARLPRVRYVGWDVAITDERGPVLVEGNDMADFDVQQKADQVGKWPLYERVMRSMPTLR